jgi:hypothetical protein
MSPSLHAQTAVPARIKWSLITGTDRGLYGIDHLGIAQPLWSGGSVRKILRAGGSPETGTGGYWALLGDQGITLSTDLLRWENRNRGLPVKTIKRYEGGEKSFIHLVQEIKDLEVHPENPNIMVCATKDAVFLSGDAGKNWENLGMPSYKTNGIKAVAAADLPVFPGGSPELTIFLSHSTYGIYYLNPRIAGAVWTELNRGLEKMETTVNPDEVSDIAVVLSGTTGDTGTSPGIYASQTFRRRVYQLDWEQKRFFLLWSDGEDFGTVDSLDINGQTIRFVKDGAILELSPPGAAGNLAGPGLFLSPRERSDLSRLIRNIPASLGGQKPLCVLGWENGFLPGSQALTLSELWLLDEEVQAVPARGREGLYLPVNHAMDSHSLSPYMEIIAERGLDMVVIDMKDDYGRLRFTPNNPAIAAKGRVFRPLDLDGFLKNMKDHAIYTVARVVVFKDPELAKKEGERFALWDTRNNKPWVGYYEERQEKPAAESSTAAGRSPTAGNPSANLSPFGTAQSLPAEGMEYEIVRTYYDERWVDPYAEEVWEYIAAIAGELHERGFDEIQFDYIRFPTDGINLADAGYRWRDAGMDMESAILSFLRHIRSRVEAPISIDIYGANGWYRTGARTGQEVELLAPYVDVICPMYYPSHFEQDFLAQDPPELRPYRIYYQGTRRTERIGRGQIIVRPYVQAFFLNVSYDRQYYNEDYVRRQVEGVRNAGGPGLTYWNNSGRYNDIPFMKGL